VNAAAVADTDTAVVLSAVVTSVVTPSPRTANEDADDGVCA
jgi:hypothetical protein